VSVAVALVVGGFVIIWAERWRRQVPPRITRVEDMSALDALKVGMLQCLALVPGTSRSGATIIGGMFVGLSRPVATEFSFFLAIPTLIGAGAYSLYKDWELLSLSDMAPFLTGLLFAFLSAWLCIRWLLRYVASHDFIPFAWYRIIFGLIVLATA
jgi:undecaprenyl-diphosphatase